MATYFVRRMHFKQFFPRCCGLTSVFIILTSTLLLSLAIGVQSDEAKTVADDEVSEDEKPAYEVDQVVEKRNCTFFYNHRSPAPEGGLVNCSWYAPSACCKRTEVTAVFSAMYPLYSTTKLCQQYINYLMCYFCSPDQYKFYQPNSKAMVCLDYCESLYEECKTAGFNKTLIGEAYANGTAFCSAQNFEVTENANCFKFNPNVFGCSCRTVPWVFNILLIIIGFWMNKYQILM